MTDDLDRILESLAQINVNLESMRVALSMVTETAADHEARIRLNERWRYQMASVMAALTFVLGALVAAVADRLAAG